MTHQTRHIIVTGKVQGVCYRDWTVQTAQRLGLAGWVRNLTDGTVEILACGDSDLLDQLEQECHKGPPAANVDNVITKQTDKPIEQPGHFTQKPTAAPNAL